LRILGIDYGDRKIGLAISDRLGLTAQPLQIYRSKNRREDEKFFRHLVSEYEITEVVVGFPLRMDGSTGTRGQKTQEFANWLETILDLPIFLWDERLTTVQAQKILSMRKIAPRVKKEIEDQVSAVIILSTYLENRKSKANAEKNR
jgi:putative Holliday junction resolvase